MIHRGPDDRQAQSNIHPGIKRQHLERDMPLVMIQRHNRVVFLPLPGGEHRVRHQRTHRIHPVFARRSDGRFHQKLFFPPAKQTVFARMRIQSANANPRFTLQHQPHRLRRQFDHIQHPFHRQLLRHFIIADVRRDHAHRQLVRIQHHATARGLGQRRENFRMPGKFNTRKIERFLVNRSRHHAIYFPGQCRLNGLFNEDISRATACCRNGSRLDFGGRNSRTIHHQRTGRP